MTGDDLLETLQADVLAILKHVPSLAGVNLLAEDEGDMEAKIARKLGTITANDLEKAGLVVVVLLPEVTEAEKNQPGPPLNLTISLQVIEKPVINRGTNGTGIRASVAALRCLAALHLQTIGHAVLYAGKKPVEPLPVKAGFLSYTVEFTLHARGLQGPGKPGAVNVQQVFLPTGIHVFSTDDIFYDGEQIGIPTETWVKDDALSGGRDWWHTGEFNGTSWPFDCVYSTDVNRWIVRVTNTIMFTAVEDVDSPWQVTTWTPDEFTVAPGGLTVEEVPDSSFRVALTTTTAEADIWYTMDGSYPVPNGPSATLKTIDIAGLQVGDSIRAAAYKTGLNPGDVLEFTITA